MKKEIYVLLFIINNKENNNKNSPQVTIKRKSGSKNIQMIKTGSTMTLWKEHIF